jgi:hypothetical protein
VICSSAIRSQKGSNKLGNEKSVMMRLGGIYALEGVMNNSEQYHEPVLEALPDAAFHAGLADLGRLIGHPGRN